MRRWPSVERGDGGCFLSLTDQMFNVRDVPGFDANARLRMLHESQIELAGQCLSVLDWQNTVGSDCPGDVALPVGMAAARMPLLHGLVSVPRRFGVVPAIHPCHFYQ